MCHGTQTLLPIFCPLSLLLDPWKFYVALDETEDKSDCKVRPLPLARGISTSCSLPLMLTPLRSGSGSNLVLRSYRAATLYQASLTGGPEEDNFFFFPCLLRSPRKVALVEETVIVLVLICGLINALVTLKLLIRA